MFIALLYVMVMTLQRINSLSSCTPVDSIFILHSELILQDRDDDKIERFFKKLIYEATSELSGIGLLAFDDVPDTFTNPVLDLTETLGLNTRRSMNAIHSKLNLNNFYDDHQSHSVNNSFIELTEAISTAHRLFESQSAGRELEALFVLDAVSDSGRLEICHEAAISMGHIETIYYLSINDEFDIDEMYDCRDKSVLGEHDAWSDLYDIMCPSDYEMDDGDLNFDKKDQFIELGSILSCNLIPIYSECKARFELSPESTIIVNDDLYDDMSYEVGYNLIAVKDVFVYLPAECTVPVLEIVEIKELARENATHNDGDDKMERLLLINVVIPDLFGYLKKAHIKETDEEGVFQKPNQDVVDNEKIQNAREEAAVRRRIRRRRRMFWDSIGSFFSPIVDVAESAKDLISGCLPDFDFSLPSFKIGCGSNGCEFTLKALSMNEEFSRSKASSNNKMTVTGTGTAKVDASITLYFRLGIKQFGPEFEAQWGWPPVKIKNLGISLHGTFRLTAKAKLTGSGDIDFIWDGITKPLTRKPLVKMIGIIPVVYWPKIGFGLEGSLNSILETHADYSFVYEANFELGARVTSSGVQLIKSFKDKTTTIDDTTFDAVKALSVSPSCPTKMPFRVAFPIKLGIEFYLAVFPHIVFKPAIKGEVIIPYSGCYSDGGCSSSKYPTGILIDPKLRLSVDVGLKASTLGFTVSCIFNLPPQQLFTIAKEFTIYNIPPKKICEKKGFVALAPWRPCCASSSSSSLKCTGYPTSSGSKREKCENGNNLNNGFRYLYNSNRGKSSAVCGKSASCWCCRMKASEPKVVPYSCTGWPTSSGSKQTRCENGNKKNDGYYYVYNDGRGTAAAMCGKNAKCWCCRASIGYLQKSIRLRSSNYPKHYVRHSSSKLRIDRYSTSSLYLKDSLWTVVPSLIGDKNYVSLQSYNYPTRYVRHSSSRLRIDSKSDQTLYKKDASWKIVPALNGKKGYISLESKNYPGRYARHRNSEIWMDKYSNKALYKDDASFEIVEVNSASLPAAKSDLLINYVDEDDMDHGDMTDVVKDTKLNVLSINWRIDILILFSVFVVLVAVLSVICLWNKDESVQYKKVSIHGTDSEYDTEISDQL